MALSSIVMIGIMLLLIIVISSLPLYFAVKILGGDASIIKVFFTNLIVGLIGFGLTSMFGLGSLLILIVTVFLYMFIFDLGIIRAIIAWLLQYVIAAVLFAFILIVFGVELGLSAISF